MKHLDNFKECNVKQLENLSDDIAEFLASKTSFDVETIMKNISALEVTLALHYVFDLKEDALIFDETKQSLVHQILTGRMSNLMMRSGANMQLDRAIDEDYYTGGLLGDGLGFGLAHAMVSNNRTIVVMDDYALNYGSSYEALLEISRIKPDFTLIILDEQKSLLRHYNSVNSAIKSIRISKAYIEIKKDMKTVLNSNPLSRPLLNTLTHVRDAIKETVIEPTIFTQFGFDYHGPINGQNLNDLIKVFRLSKTFKGPNVIHIQTRVREKKKRKLEFPAFKTDHERPDNYSDYLETLDSVLSLHNDVELVNDVHVLNDHFKQFMLTYPDQYHTSSGSIDLLMTLIAGLKKEGKHAVISLSSNLAPESLARLTFHFQNKHEDLTLIVRNAGLSSASESMSHGIYDFVLANNAPDLNIQMAKDMNEASYLLENALNKGGLNMIRIPNSSEKIEREVLNFKDVWDTIIPLNETSKGVIIAFGPSVKQLERKIRINNLNVALINARTLTAVDIKLMATIKEYNPRVIIYNCEGRFDLLSHTIFKYLMKHKIQLDVTSLNLEDVDVRLSSKEIKNQYKLNIDDVLSHFA